MMRSPLLLCLLIGASAHAAPWAPSPQEAQIVRSLSARHATWSCEQMVGALSDPAASFTSIVEHVQTPPWVAIRAAACAATLPEAQSAVAIWLGKPEYSGIATVVSQVLPTLPSAHAQALWRAAQAGPHAPRIRQALQRDPRPEARALLEQP